MAENPDPFQFEPFASFVQASFWHKLTELKLNVDRLSTERRTLRGFFSNSNAVQSVHEVDCTSFNSGTEGLNKPGILHTHGVIYNKNTIEDFKAANKVELLNTEGARMWQHVTNGDCLDDPSLLSTFIVLSFADLKKHHFYYWFAFPFMLRPISYQHHFQTPAGGNAVSMTIAEHFAGHNIAEFSAAYFAAPANQRSYFVVHKRSAGLVYHSLGEVFDKPGSAESTAPSAQKQEAFFADRDIADLYFGFSDPSCSPVAAGWPARNFLAMLVYFGPQLRGKRINLLAVRCQNNVSLAPSRVFAVQLPIEAPTVAWTSTTLGWERDRRNKMLPRMANMAASMDPKCLAETAVSLNLKLMKWRVMPTLDLDRIAATRCLLMGAGTLGCSVARNLLAWGVKHVTFVDNGKVSHSNPVRQSLFVFEDAMHARDKATAAAQRLSEICPGLQTAGHSMHIPMPGHPVGEKAEEQRQCDDAFAKLDELVRDHDAVFLLTDSRESRWLPTMLGATHDKIVINAALGFDTYLVMRHGARRSSSDLGDVPQANGWKAIGGDRLGCYFCNDITAPGNSLKDRTLDQQCTVTRPGVSNIAGALAAELLVALLQHEHGTRAAAYISAPRQQAATADASSSASVGRGGMPEGLLGILPHSIRGQLSSYETILPATERYAECIACSQKVLDEYRTKGDKFLAEVLKSSKYLEELTGMMEAFNVRDDDELLEMSSDSSDEME